MLHNYTRTCITYSVKIAHHFIQGWRKRTVDVEKEPLGRSDTECFPQERDDGLELLGSVDFAHLAVHLGRRSDGLEAHDDLFLLLERLAGAGEGSAGVPGQRLQDGGRGHGQWQLGRGRAIQDGGWRRGRRGVAFGHFWVLHLDSVKKQVLM